MEFYLLCFFGFLAGLIDSMVGGGGLVQVPAFFVLFPHLTVPQVIGSNRFASVFGTGVAAWNYSRSVPIAWRSVLYAGVAAAVFSYLGATVQGLLPPTLLKPIILLLIVTIAIYTWSKKDFGQENRLRVPATQMPYWLAGIGGVLGFYNGFVGPGTGSLLVFAFVRLIGYGFLPASATSKVVNVIADIASLSFFIMNGHVLFELAIPLMVCNVVGSLLGSQLAVLKGNGFIRQVFLVVVSGLIFRFAWDIWKMF
jgi:uncharacterized protein